MPADLIAVDDTMKAAVLQALRDPRWDFRTVEGIARDVGLKEREVAATLDELGEQVRRSSIPDTLGRPLFTVASRREPMSEKVAKLRNFLAKSSE